MITPVVVPVGWSAHREYVAEVGMDHVWLERPDGTVACAEYLEVGAAWYVVPETVQGGQP